MVLSIFTDDTSSLNTHLYTQDISEDTFKDQECLSVEGQPPACFDLDLGPMTLVLKFDLDMVPIYHCAKKKVSIPSASKVRS